MATTQTRPRPGHPAGGRFGRKEKLAAGAAALACVAAVAFGATLRAGDTGRTPPAAVAEPQARVNPYWVYVEDTTLGYFPDDFTYREDRRGPVAVASVEEQRFQEQNTQLPTGTLPVPARDWEQDERDQVAPGTFYPDDFTYREDRRDR